MNVDIQRKKKADWDRFEVMDMTKCKKGTCAYKCADRTTHDFWALLNLFFQSAVNNKVEFTQNNLQDGFMTIFKTLSLLRQRSKDNLSITFQWNCYLQEWNYLTKFLKSNNLKRKIK